MHTEHDLQDTRRRIAEVCARREQLKQALNRGSLAAHTGLKQLEAVDLELSALDSLFKSLWDATHRRVASPALNDSAEQQVNP